MIGYYVYFFYDNDQNLLYIGKTISLINRMKQHFSPELLKVEEWKNIVNKQDVKLYKCNNVCDLDIYETYFINKYHPKYNQDKKFNCSSSFELPYLVPISYIVEDARERGTFKDYCLRYLENSEQRESIGRRYPLIKEAYEVLGAEKIKALSRDSFKIKRELENLGSTELIESEIKRTFTEGFYLPKDTKIILQDIYDGLGIVKNAKATDIEKVLNVKPQSKKFNGKVIKGYFVK